MKKQFGRYELLYRFASGGMAAVYLGRLSGADGFEKRVAIKVIHPHLTEHEQFVKMFIDEARLASLIVHPNVAQIMELGRVGKTHFIAMEYVEGESLVSVLKRTRPPLRISARIIADAASGLHAAHELRGEDGELRNVVHRDVSPQNILVSYEGATKVVDFGVARARGSLHTTDGTRKGKLCYMAPEQLSDYNKIDRRTDVFALGIVLYEMTTGRMLFGGETEAAQITKVLNSPILPPKQIVEEYPDELQDLVMQALCRDPDGRFDSARELQVALERFIVNTGEPVLQAEVGEMMTELFSKQIAQKKRLKQEAEVDQRSSVPGLEVQHQTEGGVVTRLEAFIDGMKPDSPSPSGPSSVRVSRPRRGLVAAIGGAAVAIILAVVITALVIQDNDSVAKVKTPDAGRQLTVAAKADAGPPARDTVAAPQAIWIVVNASPGEAKVTLDGEPVTNPLKRRQPARPGHSVVRVSARGYLGQEIRVPLERGGSWDVTLKRKASPSWSTRPKGVAKKKTRKGKLRDDDILVSPYD